MKKTDAPKPKKENQDQGDVYEPLDMDALREEIRGIVKEKDEYFRLLTQVTADFDNYKKRNASLRADVEKDTRCAVVADFLPVLDNLERAVEHAGENPEAESSQGLSKGVDMVLKQFLQTLEKMGVTEIAAGSGEPFDPEAHNAVATVPADEEHRDNTIFDVLQKGYRMEEKVIRYAMVRVAQK